MPGGRSISSHRRSLRRPPSPSIPEKLHPKCGSPPPRHPAGTGTPLSPRLARERDGSRGAVQNPTDEGEEAKPWAAGGTTSEGHKATRINRSLVRFLFQNHRESGRGKLPAGHPEDKGRLRSVLFSFLSRSVPGAPSRIRCGLELPLPGSPPHTPARPSRPSTVPRPSPRSSLGSVRKLLE